MTDLADVHAAFPALLADLSGPAYSVALRLCGRNDADDVAQEAFVRAYKALLDYSPERRQDLQLRPWLLTIVLNVARNKLRTDSRHPVAGLAQDEDGHGGQGQPDAVSTPEAAAERSELHARLTTALLRLPLATREAVVLRHVVGCRPAEVATILDRPLGTVKAQLWRGLTALREDLGPDPLISEAP